MDVIETETQVFSFIVRSCVRQYRCFVYITLLDQDGGSK